MYKNYKRHAEHCPHCSPDRIRQIAAAERADKENRLSATAETEPSQYAGTPPSHAAVDMRLTHVFDLILVIHCAHQRSTKSHGQLGR